MLCDELGLCHDKVGILAGENVGYKLMIVAAPAAEERLISSILDKRMTENKSVACYAPDAEMEQSVRRFDEVVLKLAEDVHEL